MGHVAKMRGSGAPWRGRRPWVALLWTLLFAVCILAAEESQDDWCESSQGLVQANCRLYGVGSDICEGARKQHAKRCAKAILTKAAGGHAAKNAGLATAALPNEASLGEDGLSLETAKTKKAGKQPRKKAKKVSGKA